MPHTDWFLPTNITVENNTINPPDTTWANINYLKTLTGTVTQSTGTLCFNANTNYIIATGFNASIPAGTQFVGAEFLIIVSLNSVSDSNNIRSNLTIAQYNGTDFETNTPMNDWGYNNANTLYYDESTTDITQDIAEAGSFGIKFDAMNDNSAECYIAYVDSIKLRLHYNVVNPYFVYNGDSTSEVFITLDKNPAVTNPTTTFGIYHGDPDTTSPGTNSFYNWGEYYTEPNLNDPSGGYSGYVGQPYGTYTTNYLNTTQLSSTLSDHSISEYDVTYDVSDLVVGETYRRGLVLFNVRTPLLSYYSKSYDILYFNIEVIDTSAGTRLRNTGTFGNFVI